MRPFDVFEKLMSRAARDVSSGCPDWAHLARARRLNEPIPDYCLPGRMLNRLTPEEREALCRLTSKDVDVRPDATF